MGLRIPRLLGGMVLVLLGVAAVLGAERQEKATYLLIILGVLLGAAGNVLRRRSAIAPATWRHAANGGWLGGVLVPLVFVAALGGDASRMGEATGAGVFLGGMVAYGLGLLLSATGQLPDTMPAPTNLQAPDMAALSPPTWRQRLVGGGATVLAIAGGMLISQLVRGAVRASSSEPQVEIAKLLHVPAPHQARIEAAFDRHIKLASREADVREALDRLTDEELQAAMNGTGMDAVRRMDGDELNAWATVITEAYRQLDGATCSSVFKGQTNGGARVAMTKAIGRALAAADSTTVDHVAAGYANAIRAAVRHQAAPRVTQEAGQAATAGLFERMSPAEMEAFERAMATTDTNSVEPCRMVARLLEGARTLPNPDRTTAIRFVFQGGS